jgi:hypothetical protein
VSNREKLAALETAHRQAEERLAEIKAGWGRDDAQTGEERERILALHAQGARDRDALRVRLGGRSLLAAEAEAQAERETAEAEVRAAEQKAAEAEAAAKLAAANAGA